MFTSNTQTNELNLDHFKCLNQTGHKCTNKYTQVNTREIVDFITETTNLIPVNYQESAIRSSDKHGYQKHLIVFRDKYQDTSVEVYPQFFLKTSHDGTTALQGFYGAYRTYCLNGLMAGTSFGGFRMKHTSNFNWDCLKGHLIEIPYKFKQVQLTIDKMKQTQLTYKQAQEFAYNAINLRTPGVFLRPEIKQQAKLGMVNRVLNPNRNVDCSNDLFTVYNVVQEKLIRGCKLATYLDDEYETKHVTMRKLRGIDSTMKVNNSLWDMAVQIAA